ncbi:glycosyltransferase family 4 protein [Vibrio methylphosphonaticus]|uniref:glycosyltransferase family 4 protein n=1 Tax=Vibrio methylphosphonaticus TaxID=2946866 RepID=UPI002029CF81|nr:glycosyltransferase family 4 protein [Vibrio methylphosphonaticus]MCL9774409.1 glycosyltransferase family 4 protein [Vibrio methylphosphonaticus]
MPINNKIWLVLDSSQFGGIETHVLELAKGLKCHQQDVVVVIFDQYDKSPPLIEKLKQQQISTLILSINYPDIPKWRRLHWAMQQEQASSSPLAVVHSHGYKANILTRLTRFLGRYHNIAFVASFHAGETPAGKVRLYDWLDRYSSVYNHLRIAVSEAILAKLPLSHNAALVNNFVPLQEIQSHCRNRIAFVGRLSEEKGPDRFLEIAASCPSGHFDIYGDGIMLSQLQDNAPSNVTFHGQQQSMDAVWEHIDLLLITSRFEGLPMAALEAMSRGIPVMSFPLGQLPALIETEKNGWIVKSNLEMVTVLNLWLALPAEQRQLISQAAHLKIQQHYSTDVIIPEILDLYQHASPEASR